MLKKSNLDNIEIFSLRKNADIPPEDYLIYRVDRKNPILGNPYVLHNPNNKDERNNVITLFSDLLKLDIEKQGPMSKEIKRLASEIQAGKKLALMCWCAPKPCHGNLIKTEIKNILEQQLKLSQLPFSNDTFSQSPM